VPTFGPGVVFDVEYSIRQEQFRFFTEALRVNKLKGYVDQMVVEAEVSKFIVLSAVSVFYYSLSTLSVLVCPSFIDNPCL
jgi:hypothetical protein